ncbi:MAG: hypothetical protein WCL49_04740 [bacterium]
MITITRLMVLCVGAVALLVNPVTAADASEWAVKDASIRFQLDLTVNPSHPSAGYFVTIPDGGILPGPAPLSAVFDDKGAPLGSGVLWHNVAKGCGVVFQAPATGQSVVIYFSGSTKSKLWTPQSGLTPGAIFCETYGTASQQAAHQLGELGRVGAKAQFGNQVRTAGTYKGDMVPLALQEWRPGGTAMYLLAHVIVSDPGVTWVAPLIRAGQMDIVIDGKPVSVTKKNEKRGGVGGAVQLSAGPHRVELYGYNSAGGATGPMMLTWRTPKTTIQELGGPRAPDLKYPGTPMCESRFPRDDEIIKSGSCKIRTIQAQDGGPIASFTMSPGSVFWFPEEEAIIQYGLRVDPKGNPTGTRYTWTFDGMPGALASGSELTWLFKGGEDTGVTLTAESGGKRSTARILFYPYSEDKSSIAYDSTRADFRQACLTMVKSFSEKEDPFSGWTPGMWSNLFRVLDLQMEDPLLGYLVTQRWDFLKKKLDDAKKARLQDLFLIIKARQNPKEALKWAQEFCNADCPRNRIVMLQLKQAEILMYYLNDLEGARKIITPLLLSSGEEGEWARIRMGDLEFLSRNLNEATERYGEVQNRSKAGSVKAPAIMTKLHESTLSGPVKSADFAKKNAPQKSVVSKPSEFETPGSVADWKLSAIRDVAASETVGGLMEQGFYDEALHALKTWERSFPLNKITGDYILREATLYIALKDYKRARVILTAYCEQIDASNFLPGAMKMVRSCMIYMNEPDAVVDKYYNELLKRTQFGGGE